MSDTWTLPDYDASFDDDSTVLTLRFVHRGPTDVPRLPADVTLDSIRAEARAVAQQLVDRVQDDLAHLSQLKEIEALLVARRIDTRDEAALRDLASLLAERRRAREGSPEGDSDAR